MLELADICYPIVVIWLISITLPKLPAHVNAVFCSGFPPRLSAVQTYTENDGCTHTIHVVYLPREWEIPNAPFLLFHNHPYFSYSLFLLPTLPLFSPTSLCLLLLPTLFHLTGIQISGEQPGGACQYSCQ